MPRLFRTLALVALICGLSPAIASAQDEPAPDDPVMALAPDREQAGWIERADKAFGDYFVNYMAAVMFWDVIFWDNKLALGEGVGLLVDDADGRAQEVTGWDHQGYAMQARVTAKPDQVQVTVIDPVLRAFDGIRVEIVERDGQLVGLVPEQPVVLPAYGVEPWAEGDDVFAEGHPDAPFTVQIDRKRAKVLPVEFSVPRGTLPVVAGMKVRRGDGLFEVVEASAEALTLRSSQVTHSTDRLANPSDRQLPVVVLWLVLGAIFFTLRMSFVNLFGFAHAVKVTAGTYDNPDDPGEISHFQALTSALSATVGLGNIAGVAIAVATGGPGAIFWMICAGFLGMSSKFVECTLGQMYRIEKPDGSVSGGPMHYLEDGLGELGLGPLGKGLAILFALMCIGGSLGGGNMFQANQSFLAVRDAIPIHLWLGGAEGSASAYAIGYGLVLAFLVGLVIIGGIRRIGKATSMIVPVMCGIYLLAGFWILIANAGEVPAAFGTILREAFTPSAAYGGFVGVLVQGFRRAAFSNEAGVGSASIAHSAASTDEPVREGIVALLEPFIDTIIVCTMTGVVVVVTGAYQTSGGDGVVMTSHAFESVIGWFPLVLSAAVVLFAFSTMISWSYYGERCAMWLFGDRAQMPYRVLFLFFVFFGAVFNLGNVLTFSDLMVLGMAFPNILGAVLLSNKVRAALDTYWSKLRAGEFHPVRRAA